MKQTMQAAFLTEPGHFALREIPVPEIGAEDVLVQVRRASICGSDVRMFQEGIHVQKFPALIGHEFSGVVAAKGAAVEELAVGERIMGLNLIPCGECWWCKRGLGCPLGQALYGLGYSEFGGGCFAEYLALRGSRLGMGIWRLPDSIDDVEGALCEPFCVAPGNVDAAGGVSPGERVLVIGAGIIGNAMAQFCRHLGADVLLADVSAYRLGYANDLGLATVNCRERDLKEYVMDRWGGGPYPYHLNGRSSGMADIVFDCAGGRDTLQSAIECVRWKGRIVMSAAYGSGLTGIDAHKLMMKNVGLISGTAGNFVKAIEAIAQKQVLAKPLVSHTFPLAAVQEAFALAADPSRSMKVQFHIS